MKRFVILYSCRNVPEVECDEETDVSANHQNSQSSKQLQAHTDDLLAIHASMVRIDYLILH